MSLLVRADRHLVRAGYRSNRFVLAQVTAPASRREATRPPVNVALVLDRSGSMGGAKIALAKQAVEQALRALDERDRFSVVVYDDRIDVVMESTPASGEAKRAARQRLESIDPRGSTNLAEGWLRGCEQVALHQSTSGVNRCLLLTDGLANVGITDRTELGRHAAELRHRGVSTTTFGVGADFDEVLLQTLSSEGGGNFAFIEDARQIPDYMASEIGEALETVARDVRLLVRPDEGILVEPLGDFPASRVGDTTTIELGDLVSTQQLDAILRVNFPYGQVGRDIRVTLSLTDRDAAFTDQPVDLTWQYADDRSNDLQPRDVDMDRRVAEQFAARARESALELNRHGDYAGAAKELSAVANRIRGYAGSDAQLNSIADGLESDSRPYAAPMPAMDVKQAHFASVNMRRGKDALGRAKKTLITPSGRDRPRHEEGRRSKSAGLLPLSRVVSLLAMTSWLPLSA